MPASAHVADHGLPTGFENTELVDLIAIYQVFKETPLFLIDGTLNRLRNEIQLRQVKDRRAIDAAFQAYNERAQALEAIVAGGFEVSTHSSEGRTRKGRPDEHLTTEGDLP